MTLPSSPPLTERTTRQRLIAAAMRLFATRGYEGTSVGDIEAAAGFAARGGTLYKHFSSKEELLDAAMDHQIEQIQGTRAIIDYLPLGDLGAEVALVFRYLFDELSRYREITSVIERNGDKAATLAERFWEEIAEPGYRLGAQWLDQHLNMDGPGDWDTEALAVILVGAVVNVRRAQWTYGRRVLDVDDERLVQAIGRVLRRLR